MVYINNKVEWAIIRFSFGLSNFTVILLGSFKHKKITVEKKLEKLYVILSRNYQNYKLYQLAHVRCINIFHLPKKLNVMVMGPEIIICLNLS